MLKGTFEHSENIVPMPALLNSPVFLLVAVGGLLGLGFPLGKLATAAGVPAVIWATLISGSAAVVLAAVLLVRQVPAPADARHLRYFTVTAVVSYAMPNLLLLATIPHLGSGLTAVFYALSPVLTVLFSALAGLQRPGRLELAGIGLGLIGALLVASGRGEVGRPAAFVWLAAGLLIPVFLACGNVYRTLAWPRGSDPLWLAVGSNGVAALLLGLLASVVTEWSAARALLAIPWVVLAQVVASSLMFLLFFRLQRHGGPVTLSQIGTVAAGVGVSIGAAALGERYPTVVWVGVGVIGIALALTLVGRWRAAQGA